MTMSHRRALVSSYRAHASHWRMPLALLLVIGLVMPLMACDETALEGDPAQEGGQSDALTACLESCEACDEDSDCADVCQAMLAVIDEARADDWVACVVEDACAPGQARHCIDSLDCDEPIMIGAHCDAVARCAFNGRGVLDEAHCREHPYHEPGRWGCLEPERQERVRECLDGNVCWDMPQCLDNAICQGDPGCGFLFSTSLTVDCHRICEHTMRNCGDGGEHYGACWNTCDRAARSLNDNQRRIFEVCALEEACLPRGAHSRVDQCITELECWPDRLLETALDGATSRCGAEALGARSTAGWHCLGAVMRDAMTTCLELDACGEIAPCLDEATTCADDPECLTFLSPRQ